MTSVERCFGAPMWANLITKDMNTQKFIRVRNTDVLELIYKGHEIYDENMELLDYCFYYGTDRIQPDMVYVTPCTENNDEKGTQIMCIKS